MFDEHGRWCLYTQSFIQVMLLQAMFLYIFANDQHSCRREIETSDMP